jgi:hypothetical protein
MYIAWYWWGFRLYVDDGVLHQLINALQQGTAVGMNFLNSTGWGWLSPLASQLAAWGVTTLQSGDVPCSHRGAIFSIPWNLWNSNISCR